MRRMVFVLLPTLAVLGWSSPASADLMLEFDSFPYQVGVGDTVDVPVYLQQTAGGTQITDTNGLGIAGIRLLFDVPPVPSDPAVVASTSDITGNSQFDLAIPSLTPGQYTDLALASLLGVNVDSTGRLYLGTFRFTAGSVPGQVTNLTVEAVPGGSSFSTVNGDLLSPTSTSTTITVSSVPEPSSAVMLGSGLSALLLLASRRRRR